MPPVWLTYGAKVMPKLAKIITKLPNQVVWCVAMEQVGVQINGQWKDCLNIEGWSNDIKNSLEREELSFILEFLI